jgi:hypothetical protein
MPVRGDVLHQAVKWNDKGLGDLPSKGQPLRLEFELKHADLYAFYLVGRGWDGDHDFTPTNDTGRTDLTDAYDLLGIKRAKLKEPSGITVTPATITLELEKGVGLGYSGETAEQTITVKADDPAAKIRVSETIPWLVLGSGGNKNADGSVTWKMHAVGGALDRAVYLGKIVVHADGVAGNPVEIPVTFNLK